MIRLPKRPVLQLKDGWKPWQVRVVSAFILVMMPVIALTGIIWEGWKEARDDITECFWLSIKHIWGKIE